ncbi:TIGR01244 family sulfur transferase [Rhodoferax saidenbachensis]|uniref:TIGR01244 family protein n=1 Tax=Rhodoferax saidenbachensis TaxID=1484693 RepID=A0A1P8K587_9BURK|nr:TIGR01244 family sulfur transferase [Rhodoferax saidenbachensis]APW41173.1 TIGR01244 family protein [Rhodoferax saidenbachensis]
MPIPVQTMAPGFAVAAQLTVQQMADAAAQGFKTVINNRPDGEGGPDQPQSQSLAAAAQAQGLHYVYLPVVSGAITSEQAVAMRAALQAAPQPVLAFCRSGARSAQLYALAQLA